MTGTIFDIKHFAVHDGDGIRTTVFFKGCNLRCIWCHNPESIFSGFQIGFSKEKCTSCKKCASICEHGGHTFDTEHLLIKENCVFCGKCEEACPSGALTLYGKTVTVSDLIPELLEDADFYSSSGGGVTLSGGECLLQSDFCAELLCELKKHDIHTAVDTCGFVSRKAIEKVIPYTDVFLYDVKAIDEDVHIKCTGFTNKPILENLKYLDECGKNIEIRIPYVPDYNSEQIPEIAEFLSTLRNISKVKVLPYHKFAGSKYDAVNMPNTLPEKTPSKDEITIARNLIRSYGLNVSQ